MGERKAEVECGCENVKHPGAVADNMFPAIYTKLIAPLPEEAIEKTDKAKTRRGYDTTGFQYQYLVDRLNEAIGIDGWAMDWKIIKDIPGTWGTDKKPVWEVVVEVTIVFYKKGINDPTNPHGVYRKCVGCHKAEMYGDALKGAITNGFKKTVAFFGLGAQAYRGTIDDDYMPIPNDVKEDKGGDIVGFVRSISYITMLDPLGDGAKGNVIFKITMDNGETYRTPFKESAEIAKKAKEEKGRVKISFSSSGSGYQISAIKILP